MAKNSVESLKKQLEPIGKWVLKGLPVVALLVFVGTQYLFTSNTNGDTGGDSAGATKSTTKKSSLPPHLISKHRKLLYEGLLTESWSKEFKIDAGYNFEVRTLEDGATAKVRWNGEETNLFTTDINATTYVDGNRIRGHVTQDPITEIEVTAADEKSKGKRFAIFLITRRD